MPIDPVDKIWMNGKLVDWENATVHVLSHALHYGTGVFEGIRCYETSKGPAVFRLRDHLERMERSGKIFMMEIPYAVDDLVAATHELIKVNKLDSLLRPPDRVPRLRRGRRQPGSQPRRRHDRGVEMGRVPRRGSTEERRAHDDLVVATARPEHHPAGREGHRCVHQLGRWRSRRPCTRVSTRRSC